MKVKIAFLLFISITLLVGCNLLSGSKDADLDEINDLIFESGPDEQERMREFYSSTPTQQTEQHWIIGLADLLRGDSDSSLDIDEDLLSSQTVQQTIANESGLIVASSDTENEQVLDLESSSHSNNVQQTQPTKKGYWELVKTEEVIPETYTSGDNKDSREYAFEYSSGMIGCRYYREVYDGIKKAYIHEEIETSGRWSQPGDDGAYLPDEKIKITLTASIDSFQRLTPLESGGNGTNFSGVNVWAYTGNTGTAFGNATQGILKGQDGTSVCSATISDGKIKVQSATLEVSGVLGSARNGETKVLFIVVSNQGRVGGIKYFFEFAE